MPLVFEAEMVLVPPPPWRTLIKPLTVPPPLALAMLTVAVAVAAVFVSPRRILLGYDPVPLYCSVPSFTQVSLMKPLLLPENSTVPAPLLMMPGPASNRTVAALVSLPVWPPVMATAPEKLTVPPLAAVKVAVSCNAMLPVKVAVPLALFPPMVLPPEAALK